MSFHGNLCCFSLSIWWKMYVLFLKNRFIYTWSIVCLVSCFTEPISHRTAQFGAFRVTEHRNRPENERTSAAQLTKRLLPVWQWQSNWPRCAHVLLDPVKDKSWGPAFPQYGLSGAIFRGWGCHSHDFFPIKYWIEWGMARRKKRWQLPAEWKSLSCE